MARFDDSPELFGRGVGTSTGQYVKCEFCGTEHNIELKDLDCNDDTVEGDSVLTTYFGDLLVADCCFEKIEKEILSRMADVLRWFVFIIKSDQDWIDASNELIKDIRDALTGEREK